VTDSILFQAFVYLAAAVLFVRSRSGSASAPSSATWSAASSSVHGSSASSARGAQGHALREFGVVMMLFVVGLELRPALLWQLRRPIVGLGGLQSPCRPP